MAITKTLSKKFTKSDIQREEKEDKKDKKDKKEKKEKKDKKDKKGDNKKDKKDKKKGKGKEKEEDEEEQQVPTSASAPSGSSSAVPLTNSAPAPSKAASSPDLEEEDEDDELAARAAAVLKNAIGMDKNCAIISVVGATGLKNVDLIGKSDPFVKVKLMDRSGAKMRTFKTKVKKNNLNPEWNEDFMFVFRFGTGIEDYIINFEVYDEDATKETFLGMCSQGMIEIMGDNPGRVMEMKLEPKKSNQSVKGTLKVAVRFPTPEEVEEMGANFSGKVAKALVNYITYSCADAIAKMKPDAAIFECEAEVTLFNIVFIYVLNILIPLGSPSDLFEIKKEMAFEALQQAVLAKTSSKGKALVKNLPKDAQKIIANFMPKFLDQLTPILNASRKAQPSGGSETQMGIGVKPIIRIPPPPAPPVVGAEIALKVIFASMPKGAPPPPPTTFSAMALANDQPENIGKPKPAPLATPAAASDEEPPKARLPPSLLANIDDDDDDKKKKKGKEAEDAWIPDAGENMGMLDVVNNSVIIRVEEVKGLQHKSMTGKCNPYVLVTVTDRSGSLPKKFKTDPKEGQQVAYETDFLYILPFGRSIDEMIANFSVFHSNFPTGKKFLGQCERPVVDIMGPGDGGETAEMTLMPKKQGDFCKGSLAFSIRKPTDDDIETIGTSVSSKITRHLVSYILYSCADAIVKGATLPSCVRFECEAEITVFNICFIFILSVSIPYGAPTSSFETSKDVAFENLTIGVSTKGVPKLFSKVPESSQKMVDSYLPRFMEQLMLVIEGARKPMTGNQVYMELGVGMKPSFALPFPPNPPVLTGTIAFRVFIGTGGRDVDTSIPNNNFQAITNREGELQQREEESALAVAEARNKAAGAPAKEGGSMIITVIGATKLRSVNLTGKSDPFVKVKIMEIGGKKIKKFATDVIKNKTTCNWDQNFLFTFPLNKSADEIVLQLMVYDKGLSSNTFLGQCEQSFANILRNDCGNAIEMQLQPKKKGDSVKGAVQFSVRPATAQDLEDMGADTASKLARCLVAYIAFSFANAIVKMKPKNARFEAEAEFSVFGICFIFCATVVIPLGSKPDCFESKRDEAYELLQVCCQQQKKKIVAKVPKNAKSLLNSFLPRFMEQCNPIMESSRKSDEQKLQVQTGIGIKPEFALPFPPAPPVITGNIALRAIFGMGGDVSAAPFRGFAFHQTLGPVANDELRVLPDQPNAEKMELKL